MSKLPSSKNFCPCGSKKTFTECCENYIQGKKLPLDAESLMRSRYTAYTLANIPYIEATMREDALAGFDSIEAEKWAKTAKWLRLKVLSSYIDTQNNHLAYVTFQAFFILNGKKQVIEEKSLFKLIDGRWFYIRGLCTGQKTCHARAGGQLFCI